MGELFGAGFELPYEKRLDILMASGIALWDVLRSCVRPGSLDSSIDSGSVTANDFGALFAEFPTIRQVFLNGKKAAEMYRRCVLSDPGFPAANIPVTALPSTSPAHAAMSFGQKLSAWSVVRDAAISD